MVAFLELLRNHPFAVALIGGLALFAAILIHRLLKTDMRYLKKDIDNLDTNLSKEMQHLKGDIDNLDTKLSKEMQHLDAKLSKEIQHLDTKLSKEIKHTRDLLITALKPIQEQLTNHVTDTDKKIDKLAEGQAALFKGQATLEAKIDLLLKDRKQPL